MLELHRLGEAPGPVCHLPLGMGHVRAPGSTHNPHRKGKQLRTCPWTQGENPTDTWPSLPNFPQLYPSLLLSASFASLFWTSFRCWSSQGSSSSSLLSPCIHLPLPELPLSLVELPQRNRAYEMQGLPGEQSPQPEGMRPGES